MEKYFYIIFQESVMMVKKMSLFLFLFVVSIVEMNIQAAETPHTKRRERRDLKRPWPPDPKRKEGRNRKKNDLERDRRRVVFQFEAMYEKFLKQVDENEEEHEQAQELCEKAGNCDECPRFQKADAEKNFYDKKVQLIEEVNQLHAELHESGIENGFDRQRTIRKIINGS